MELRPERVYPIHALLVRYWNTTHIFLDPDLAKISEDLYESDG